MLRINRTAVLTCPGVLGVLLLFLCVAPRSAAAADVPVTVITPNSTSAKVRPPEITVSFVSKAVGHLFRSGQPIDIVTRITNPDAAQQATVTTCISNGQGIIVTLKNTSILLPEKGAVNIPVFPQEQSARLPNGAYTLEISVMGAQGLGYGETQLNIWKGPAETTSEMFGISYNGPLNTARTLTDLDLFHQAGIGWLRFPLQGWLPQGDAHPAEVEFYKTFIGEASKREMSLVANFTPKTTVDPSVNSSQTVREVHDSLFAATTHYGFKIKYWDLQRVKPDPAFPEMKGIGPAILAEARQAMEKSDKSLKALFTVDDPIKWNAMEWYAQKLPLANDVLGLRYDFTGLPEVREANPPPPAFELEDVRTNAQDELKRTPPIWASEYGFDAAKADHLPSPIYQAALISRALMLNCANGITRTFWRHTPDAPYDLPFTTADGSAMPSLLALRTTLQMLNGVTEFTVLTPPIKHMHALLAHINDKHKKGIKPHYLLIVWSENTPMGVTFKSHASQVTVTDLWGNTMDLHTVEGAAMCPVDEFPRFIDIGENNDDLELFTPFASFDPVRLVLHDNGPNKFALILHNDERLFHGKLSLDLNFRRWPELNDDSVKTDTSVHTEKIVISPSDRTSLVSTLTIPDNKIPKAHKGEIFQLEVEIYLGTRHFGSLCLPVWYQPDEVETKPATP